jgi:hypothetical protein
MSEIDSNTWLWCTALAMLVPILIPAVQFGFVFRIWDRYNKPVNKDMCACSCWDTVFKGNFYVYLFFYLTVFVSVYLLYFCPFVTSLLLFRIWDRYNKPVNKDMCGVLVGNFHVYLFFYLVSVLVAVSLIFCISVLFVIFSSFSVFLFYSSSEFEIGTINWSTKICALVLVGIRSSKVNFVSICPTIFLSLCLSLSCSVFLSYLSF